MSKQAIGVVGWILGMFKKEAATDEQTVRDAVNLTVDGREDAIDRERLFQALKNPELKLDGAKFAELVSVETIRRENVKRVAAGREAAETHRVLSAQVVAMGEQYKTDLANLARDFRKSTDEINVSLSPLLGFITAGQNAERELSMAANDRKYAGMTRDQRIAAVNAELSAGAESVEHIKELERKARNAGASLGQCKAAVRDLGGHKPGEVPSSFRLTDAGDRIDKANESLRAAEFVKKNADERLAAAKACFAAGQQEAADKEAEVLGAKGFPPSK